MKRKQTSKTSSGDELLTRARPRERRMNRLSPDIVTNIGVLLRATKPRVVPQESGT